MAKVFLSAGHGGSDPGAVAFNIKEKDVNLQALLSCKEVLEAHGVDVVCSRIKDENDDVKSEVNEANASGADIAVSFHANAGGGDGFEAFYYTTNEKGKKLAQLGEKYVKELGQNSRGVKSGNHLWFIKKTTMPAVLYESFFVDNDKDNDIGDTVAEQKKFGVAYAKAILEFLGIAYGEKSTANEDKTPEKATGGAEKKATDAAKSFSKAIAGTYTVTAKSLLNVRNGAGFNKNIMVSIPHGTKVKCYGYYTTASGVKWLYVQFTYNKITYTGFCSSDYLAK